MPIQQLCLLGGRVMVSAIDPDGIDSTKPIDGVAASKKDLRNNLAAIKANDIAARSEIEALQSAVTELQVGTLTPHMFADDPSHIGAGVSRKLSTDYGSIVSAQAAYPHVADEIKANGDLSTISHDWAALQSMSNYAHTLALQTRAIHSGRPIQYHRHLEAD